MNELSLSQKSYYKHRSKRLLEMKEYRKKHKTYFKKKRREYYEKNKEKEKSNAIHWMKVNHNWWRTINIKALSKYRIGVDSNFIFKRDKYKCRLCNEKNDLVVHHVDGNGRNKPKQLKNNSLNNLITMCRQCHTRHHHKGKKKCQQKLQKSLTETP